MTSPDEIEGKLFAELDRLGVKYEVYRHPADDSTLSAVQALQTKTLFISDRRKTRRYLLMVATDRRVDFKQLGKALASAGEMKMASDVGTKLQVEPDATSVFSVINDRSEAPGVIPVIDEALMQGGEQTAVLVRPNHKHATMATTMGGVMAFLRAVDHLPVVVKYAADGAVEWVPTSREPPSEPDKEGGASLKGKKERGPAKEEAPPAPRKDDAVVDTSAAIVDDLLRAARAGQLSALVSANGADDGDKAAVAEAREQVASMLMPHLRALQNVSYSEGFMAAPTDRAPPRNPLLDRGVAGLAPS